MNNFITCSLFIGLFTPMYTMDISQEHMTWIKTNDDHLIAINKQIAAQSALITVLTENGKNSNKNPLHIPINSAELNFFCETVTPSTKNINNPCLPKSYPAQQLLTTLSHNDYSALMNVADKLKAQAFYVNLADALIPQDVSSLCIPEHIRDAIRNKIIATKYTKNELLSGQRRLFDTPEMIITDNGHYFMHDIRLDANDYRFSLWNTKTCSQIKGLHSRYTLNSILFSPNNKYIIVQKDPNTFVYDIAKDKQHPLILPTYFNIIRDIMISPDSKHIMISGIMHNNTVFEQYALWSFDADNIPQPVVLDWVLIPGAIFHPNSKQIIYNEYRKTLQTCTIESPNNFTLSGNNGQYFKACNFDISIDGARLLARYSHEFKSGECLFNIENLDNVTCTELPNQQPITATRKYIPCKKLVTHISDDGHTLSLLNSDACLIASHTAHNTTISALAGDKTGNYFASGYTNGTIIIWDLSHNTKHIYGTKIRTPGTVTSLCFGDNQLLFSQSVRGFMKSQSYATILWDVHGNKVLNFGPMITSIMSKNGNRIITVAETLKATNEQLDEQLSGWHDSFVTLTAWNLHNKKTKKLVDSTVKKLTLSQAVKFSIKYAQEQEKK